MVRSMTGYGRGIAALDGREMTIELKAVNHRYLDVSFRMPRALSYIEDPLRKRLQQALSRGHVDVFLNYKNTREDARAVQVDVPLLHAYRRALETICQETGAQDDMTLSRLARLPEVMAFTETEEDEQAVLQLCMQAAEEALASLCAMRSVEGERLASDIAARLGAIAEMVAQIEHRVPCLLYTSVSFG